MTARNFGVSIKRVWLYILIFIVSILFVGGIVNLVVEPKNLQTHFGLTYQFKYPSGFTYVQYDPIFHLIRDRGTGGSFADDYDHILLQVVNIKDLTARTKFCASEEDWNTFARDLGCYPFDNTDGNDRRKLGMWYLDENSITRVAVYQGYGKLYIFSFYGFDQNKEFSIDEAIILTSFEIYAPKEEKIKDRNPIKITAPEVNSTYYFENINIKWETSSDMRMYTDYVLITAYSKENSKVIVSEVVPVDAGTHEIYINPSCTKKYVWLRIESPYGKFYDERGPIILPAGGCGAPID